MFLEDSFAFRGEFPRLLLVDNGLNLFLGDLRAGETFLGRSLLARGDAGLGWGIVKIRCVEIQYVSTWKIRLKLSGLERNISMRASGTTKRNLVSVVSCQCLYDISKAIELIPVP